MQLKEFTKAKEELERFESITKIMFKNDNIYNYYIPRNTIELLKENKITVNIDSILLDKKNL